MLPVVKPGIAGSILHDLNGSKGNKYITDQLERIVEKNPCIASFIANFCFDEKSSEEEINLRAVCGIMVYRLLESQAEADDLL